MRGQVDGSGANDKKLGSRLASGVTNCELLNSYERLTGVAGDGSTFSSGAGCRTEETVGGGVNVVVLLFPLVCRTFILDTSWHSKHRSRIPYKLRVLARNLTA